MDNAIGWHGAVVLAGAASAVRTTSAPVVLLLQFVKPVLVNHTAAALLLLLIAGREVAAGNIHSDSLASVVPPSAGFFVELDRIAADGTAGRTDVANHVYELLVGSADARRGLTADLQRMLRNLGIKPGRTTRELASRRIAIAAPSWKRLAQGILIVRLRKGDDLIEQIFTPGSKDTIGGRRRVIVFRTEHLLSAATNGKVLIISQRSITGSLFEQTVRLMMGTTPGSLAEKPDFAQRLRALPAGPNGLVYINAADAKEMRFEMLDLDLSRLAIGMYFRDDGVEFAFQADALRRNPTQPSAANAFERAGTLPQTTLAAWCTRVNVRDAFQGLLSQSVDRDTPAFVKLLVEVFDVDPIMRDVIARLGPNAMFVWDQHLGTGPDLPQVAVLFESDDAPQCAASCAQAVQVVVDWLDLKGRNAVAPRLRLSQSEYLGVPLYELAMPVPRKNTPGPHSDQTVFSPAFAAVGNWFVLAASADHIRNIIDAQWSLAPRLSDLDEFASLAHRAKDSSTIAMAQPQLAAQVIGSWLSEPQGPVVGWFNTILGNKEAAPEKRRPAPRLGIGMKPGDLPGTVLVARVYPNGRAYGRLRPGDRIIGANGQLLSLDEPRRDLRRKVITPPQSGRWTFRVQRQDQTLDIVVPSGGRPGLSPTAADPTGALRQLQRLFKLVDFASVRVIRSQHDHLSGVLALRFTTPPNRP